MLGTSRQRQSLACAAAPGSIADDLPPSRFAPVSTAAVCLCEEPRRAGARLALVGGGRCIARRKEKKEKKDKAKRGKERDPPREAHGLRHRSEEPGSEEPERPREKKSKEAPREAHRPRHRSEEPASEEPERPREKKSKRERAAEEPKLGKEAKKARKRAGQPRREAQIGPPPARQGRGHVDVGDL